MRALTCLLLLVLTGVPARAAEPAPTAISPEEVRDGWLLLFDQETKFGWTTNGDVSATSGELRLGGKDDASVLTTTKFGNLQLRFEYRYEGDQGFGLLIMGERIEMRQRPGTAARWLGAEVRIETDENQTAFSVDPLGPRVPGSRPSIRRPRPPSEVGFGVPAGGRLFVRNVRLKPLGLESLFNGKDLTGWKVFPGARYKSQFTVTPEGWINVKNGPGDLQTEKTFADFVFQGECISNGDHLNSGIFVRCLPKEYQQGYEMQIRNEWKDNDRTKPVDYGTGAIYRRQPARKVVSTDREWFTMTLVAHGNHFATWVNGYQVTDWTDTRPEHENARNGLRLGAGHLSIQGHDPTTDLSFRNLRVAELKKN